jgi:hypothetical protein
MEVDKPVDKPADHVSCSVNPLALCSNTYYKIVKHVSIATQRLGKHTPAVTFSIIGHPLLGNGPIDTHSSKQKTVFSVGYVPRIIRGAHSRVRRNPVWRRGRIPPP